MHLERVKWYAGAVLATLAAASAARADGSGQPLFASDEALEVRITAPLATLMRHRSDTEYLAGTLAYVDAQGGRRSLDLKLRARGEYRRQRKTCDLPPIRLNFRKKQVEGTVFAGQDKLKLVTHCNPARDAYEQYVLKEYLAYRIFNAVTEHSFRARLLRITYVDSDRGGRESTRYGFVIEDDDLLARRTGADVVRIPHTGYPSLEPRQAALVAVFQYLIGNTDFSLVAGARDDDCCHNVALFTAGDGGYLAIPYDFDFSGLVNARYAEPNPKLRIRSVVRRLYRGACLHNDYVDAAVDRFRSSEESVMHAARTVEGVDENVRATALRYLSAFYEDIADTRSVEKNLLEKCL